MSAIHFADIYVMVDKMAERNTNRKRRKKKRYILPVMLFLAIVSVASAAGLIYLILEKSNNPLMTNQPDVSLPNFVGMTEEQAHQQGGFVFEKEYVFSSEYDKDVIIAQKPTAPRTVKGNSTVKIKVSKGAMSSTMPDLLLDPKEKARRELSDLGVDIYIKMEASEEIPNGLVIRTEPEAGETIKSGDIVTIYIAADEINKTRISPNVIGLQAEEARQAISEAGLRVKVVLTANEQPFGTVIWQSYGPEAEVPVGTEIEIHVSAGQ